MIEYGVRVTFLTEYIHANNRQEVDEKINELLDQLAAVKTDLVWDDVEWDIVSQNKPEPEEN